LARGVDVSPLAHQIVKSPELWNQNKLRQTYADSPHAAADDIWLRFQSQAALDAFDIDDLEVVNYPAFWKLPQARAIIFGLMTQVGGERLGRCVITRLKPGGRILPHEDGGLCASYYDRYQIALNSEPGCSFSCGGETVEMRTGDVWWFNNELEHSVTNNSASDRLSLIVDIRCSR
jgi:hypothetical protein